MNEIPANAPVISADGRAIGFVSRVGMTDLRVTSMKDGRGFDHLIPFEWVAHVDRYVFLNKSSAFVGANCGRAEPSAQPRRKKAA